MRHRGDRISAIPGDQVHSQPGGDERDLFTQSVRSQSLSSWSARPALRRNGRCSRTARSFAPVRPRAGGAPGTSSPTRAPPVHGTSQEAINDVVRAANRTLVLVSGGARAGDEAMLEKATESMAAGATGLIFGRNVWQREYEESLRFVDRLREVLAKYPTV